MVTVPQQAIPSGLITAPPTGPAPVYFEGSVGVPDMPTWVKQIPEGALLQGVVQGRTANNAYSVLTAQGPITITSALALQAGTQLLFQIGPEVANQRLQLVGGTNPQAALPNQPVTVPAVPALPGTLPTAVAGSTLNAIVIRPADPPPVPGATPSPAAPLPPAASGILPQAAVAAYAPGAVSVAATADPAAVAMTGLSQPAPGRGAAPTAGTLPNTPAPAATPGTPAAPPTAPAVGNIPLPLTGMLSAAAGTPATSGNPAAVPPTPQGTAPQPPQMTAAPSLSGTAAASSAPAVLNAAPSVFSVTQPGEQVSLKLVAITPPAADAPDAPAPMPQASSAAPARAAASAPAPLPPSPLGFLREGLASLLSLAGAEPAGSSPTASSAPPAPLPPGTVTATVIGNGAQNRPIITIGTAVLSLESAPLPPGTQVQLVPQLGAALPAAATAQQAPAAPLQSFPTYPSLPAMIAAAQQTGGQTEQAIMAMLPRLGPQLAASLMVFASGAAKGDLRTLVGDSARASLEKTGRGRAALAGATQEFEAAGEEARGTSGTEWRSITLPVMTGGATIDPIRLYLHQVSDEESERNQKNEGGGQRFLLDLNLTHIGSLQVDGLAKPNQLDLVIRTPEALPQTLRNDIRTIFLDSAIARGVAGSVIFQVAPKLVPETGAPAHRRGGLMV